MNYESMLKHIQTCEEAIKVQKEGRENEGFKQIDHATIMKNKRATIAQKFNDVAQVMKIAEGCKFPEELFIF